MTNCPGFTIVAKTFFPIRLFCWQQTFPSKIISRKDSKLGPSIHNLLWPSFCDQLFSIRAENLSVKGNNLVHVDLFFVLEYETGFNQHSSNQSAFLFCFYITKKNRKTVISGVFMKEILQWNISKAIMATTISELKNKL